MQSNRRVRFHCDDDFAAYGPITAERLTCEIRNCYDTVDQGRKLLGRLYDKLHQRGDAERYGNWKKDYQLMIELDNLKDVLVLISEKRGHYIKELENAQDILWHDRKEMEEFLRFNRATEKRLQEKVRFFNSFSKHPESLVTEIHENSKILGEILTDLKRQMMAEEQFIKRQAGDAVVETEAAFSGSPRDRWSYIRGRRSCKEDYERDSEYNGHRSPERNYGNSFMPSDMNRNEIPSRDGWQVGKKTSLDGNGDEISSGRNDREIFDKAKMRVERSSGERKDDCDTSSLSQKLRQLVKQSENVQKLISDSSRKVEGEKRGQYESCNGSSQSLLPNEYLKKSPERSPGPEFFNREKKEGKSYVLIQTPESIPNSIPDPMPDKRENVSDKRSRTDLDDSVALRRSFENVLLKCEEVEKKMQSCSPREVRENLLHNLNQLDKADMETSNARSSASSPLNRGFSWKKCVDHDNIRQEFVNCLDKIFAMEKCYGSAGDEIHILKRELEEALREKDAVEASLRNENEKLQERVQLKAKDVDFYRDRIRELKKELFDLKSKHESQLAAIESEREDNSEEIKEFKEECEQLKIKVEAKSKEVDELRNDLENAIEEIHSLKGGSSERNKQMKTSKEYRTSVTSTEQTITTSKGSNQDNITEELIALQKVIETAEGNQRKSFEENSRLKQENSHLAEENAQLQKENQELRSLHGKYEEGKSEELKERIEELELVLIARNAEIDHLTKRGYRVEDETAKENYDMDLKMKEVECERLKKKLSKYEELIAQEGGDISIRLEEMYEECLKSVEKINREKENIEKDFQRQRRMYEDLLAECHNEISDLTKRDSVGEVMSNLPPGKMEVLEALMNSVQSPEELAAILSRDIVDGPTSVSNMMKENETLQAENAELRKKVENVEKEVNAHLKETDAMKKRNKELKDKYDLLKSENYLLSRIREDDGKEKLKTYKEMLGKKEEECSRLRRILDESIDYDERDELLARLREVHRELIQDGNTKEEVSLENLKESLEKRDREISRLKRQNRLLVESFGVDEPSKKLVLEAVLTSKREPDEYSAVRISGDQERTKMIESENRILRRQVDELKGKLQDNRILDETAKELKKRVKQSEEQCITLEDENFSLRERLRSLQNEIKELSSLSRSRKFCKDRESDELLKENENLSEKFVLKELENERLSDQISNLKGSLRNSEIEAADLRERIEAKSQEIEELKSLKQENVEKDEILKDISKKLGAVEKERKKANEAYIRQKVRNEEDTKHMGEQIKRLQSEIASITASSKMSTPLADSLNVSRESLPMDEKDGGISRYDRNRLIKKLQQENHQQSARLLSLEEETTAIAKIIADMERGHGHLTGILRGHLVLQKEATAKLLEKSLQQYSDEIESCKKKFRAVEDRYDKNRKNLTRRSFAWDLFENATATVDNITAILVEGLIKVEDDLQEEFSSDEDFETRDYKSRIWLLRRRLDDVEKRYRDLMLRAEELSVRLDAKTAEYDVTQDELEDATRVLEVNEITMSRLREELSASGKENARLKGIMSQLKEHQEQTVGSVIAENEQLRREIDKAAEDRSEIDGILIEMKSLRDKLALDDFEVREMRRRLHEQERREKEAIDSLKEQARNDARKCEEEASKVQNELKLSKKKVGEGMAKIDELENLLRKAEEKIGNLEKQLQKARSGCRSDGIDHHGTIHMLRDDLKKLFKENEELKDEISNKQKRITALAKDLREANVTVKEQLGTGRTLDEKILDRAAKDQIMALRRKIKILEMENNRLVKKANNLERDQSFGEAAKKKKQPRTKGSLEETTSELSSSFRADEDSSTKAEDTLQIMSSSALGNEERIDADNSLASIESFKDFSQENNEEIELRDNLIKELEMRVRELKLELAKRNEEERSKELLDDEAARTTLDGRSIAERDVEMLKRENESLKESLEKQKERPVSYQVKQKEEIIKAQRQKLDDLEGEIGERDEKVKILQKELSEMRERLGKDWRSKEFILLDSDEYKELEEARRKEIEDLKNEAVKLEAACEDQKNIIERLEQERKTAQVGEEQIQAISEVSVEGGLPNFPENDSNIAANNSSKRSPKFINISKSNKAPSSDDGIADKGKNISRIPMSPRLKQSVVGQSKAEKPNQTKKDLEKKIEEQDEDIKTLLQSIDVFEKEVEEMKEKAKELESLKEKLKKSDNEVKTLKQKNTKLQNQVKETKAYDEKLQILEDKMKNLNTENRNLEQQMKKFKRGEEQRTKSQDEASTKKIASLEKVLDDTRKRLDTETSYVSFFKAELEMKDIEKLDDEGKVKRAIKDSIDKKLKKERDLISEEGNKRLIILEKEMEEITAELKQKTNSVNGYIAEVNTLKGNLEEAKRHRDGAYAELEESKDQLNHLAMELDRANARNVALEAVRDAVALSEDSFDGRSDGKIDPYLLKSAWKDLKGLLKDLKMFEDQDAMSNTDNVEDIVDDIEKVSRLVADYSGRIADELSEQQKINLDLETRVEEFRRIVEETNKRVSELEDEISEKEEGDEIGHKLLLDQINSLKKNAEIYENERTELQDELKKREDYIERLTGQVKFLERQVSQRETEISELTQRALDSEDELEQMKIRVEELEDDYNKLLQYGMRLGDEEEGDEKDKRTKAEVQEELEALKATIDSLQEDKITLENQVEELTIANEEIDKFGEDKGKEDEQQKLEDTVYRLELDKADLQKRIDEFLANSENEAESLKTKLEDSEKKIKSLEDAMFRIELEKASLQKAFDDSKGGHGKEDNELRVKITELEDENSRMEEAIYQLDVERENLRKKIAELTSDEAKGDVNDLTLLLIDNEDKIADLEQEKKILAAKEENLKKILDDILVSPRSDEGESSEEEHREILKGGPQSWKRRLIGAYRELREKSTELAMMKMIVESKNVEVDLLSKEIGDDSLSEGISSLSEDEKSGRRDTHKQLKATVFMLQEEVKIKSSEINDLRNEISSLKNEIEVQESRNIEGLTVRVNGREESDLKNEELSLENENLKVKLNEKEEQYDALCDQMFGGEPIVTASEKEQLKNEIESLKNELATKDKSLEELEENYELVYNELTRMKAGISSEEKSDADLGDNENKIEMLEKALVEYEEKYHLMSQDFDELEEKYREEMNYASTHIGQLMLQVGELQGQLQEMRENKAKQSADSIRDDHAAELMIVENRLKNAEDDLKRKNELITNLKETLANIYEDTSGQSESLSKELKRLAKENNDLQDQLDLQRQRYATELDSMRTAMTSMKDEHVLSLKEDFEKVCEDKVTLQVELSEMSEKLSKQERRIKELIELNEELEKKTKSDEEDDVLDLLDFKA